MYIYISILCCCRLCYLEHLSLTVQGDLYRRPHIACSSHTISECLPMCICHVCVLFPFVLETLMKGTDARYPTPEPLVVGRASQFSLLYRAHNKPCTVVHLVLIPEFISKFRYVPTVGTRYTLRALKGHTGEAIIYYQLKCMVAHTGRHQRFFLTPSTSSTVCSGRIHGHDVVLSFNLPNPFY